MSRNYGIIENKTDWPDSALRVLLDLAWDVVNRDVKLASHGPVYKVSINFKASTDFRGRHIGYKSILLGFRDPSKHKSFSGQFGTVRYENFTEIFVGIAAWMFAAAGSTKRSLIEAICRDAVLEARTRAATLSEQVTQAQQAVVTRENEKFARQVLKNMETGTVEYKLKRLESQEKTWNRKLKLATTKLAGLRRRRSAIIAASKRSQKCLQDQTSSL